MQLVAGVAIAGQLIQQQDELVYVCESLLMVMLVTSEIVTIECELEE